MPAWWSELPDKLSASMDDTLGSHDVSRGRGGLAEAIGQITVRTLIAGIDSDRLFPLTGQDFIARHLGCEIVGGSLQVIESAYGHDGFLIERDIVGPLLKQLLEG